ncbi:hypothetical protein DFQ27_000547 [Actinomortierella ambigua]|uniref:Uncharacterized protein n=1 Tax=Actinomortierella ambigua TaxID=1343610 RepID=A0A9P6TWE4_9FUNG|nr:hypothetical protein DFQ27_000547 [Actinomortierella ambigua]
MPNLPFDCIARTIEWVDGRQDLFNLLTVNRDIFAIAARRLYHEPIKTSAATFDWSIQKMLLLLLSLSPADDECLTYIRTTNGLPVAGTPLNPPPMLNYLSLVKVVRWKGRVLGDSHVMDMLDCCDDRLRTSLTWALVGHRLDEIEELEIDVADGERYLANAAKMNNLRMIWTRFGNDHDYKDMHNFSEAMIKAIQLNHGPNLLRECHMIPNPLVWGPDTGVYGHEVHDLDDYELRDIDIRGAQRALSHLPPPRHPLTLPRSDGSTVTLDQTFDPYVATIREMANLPEEDMNLVWGAMFKAYPGLSQSQLLQRFRGLVSLTIHPDTANGDDENILAWAACEAEHRYHEPCGCQHVPLISLRELVVRYDNENTKSTAPRSRPTAAKWKILQDGLLGFSSTLDRLQVFYPRSVDGMVDQLFTVPRPLLQLKSLVLREMAIDASVWDQMPNIEVLTIRFSFPLFNLPTTETQDDLNGMTMPMAVDTAATNMAAVGQPSLRQLPEFSLHSPSLRFLYLEDRAVNLFDPNCLQHLPNLQSLEMSSFSLARKRIIDGGIDSNEAQDALRKLYPTRWTWDWSLPNLTNLKLMGDLNEFGFSFAILRSCPAINSFSLVHRDAACHFPLCVKGILDTPLGNSGSNNGHSSRKPSFTCLTTVSFVGDWDIERGELECLIQALPGLNSIHIESGHYSEGFDCRELISMTKTHPALTEVNTSLACTTQTISELGLRNHQEWYQEERELYGDDYTIPRPRMWIGYHFQNLHSAYLKIN